MKGKIGTSTSLIKFGKAKRKFYWKAVHLAKKNLARKKALGSLQKGSGFSGIVVVPPPPKNLDIICQQGERHDQSRSDKQIE